MMKYWKPYGNIRKGKKNQLSLVMWNDVEHKFLLYYNLVAKEKNLDLHNVP